MAERRNKLTIENLSSSDIFARNFKGAATTFRPAGKRTFCLWLDPDMAEALAADGWNIKMAKPLDPEDDPRPYIEVEVSYRNVPPKVVLVTKRNKKVLDDDTIHMVDSIQIESADVRISPYYWELNGRSGVKAYLDSMWITMVEDPLEEKYADIPYSSTTLFMSGEDEG